MSKRLVVHSNQEISTRALKELASISEADEIKKISEFAFRLENIKLFANSIEEIRGYCIKNELDFAVMRAQNNFTNIRLIVMDMDSTLINIECIDEIADFCNLKAEVSAITESAMRGEIDFEQSLRRRVALLKGVDQSVLQRVYDERLQLNPNGEFMLSTLQKHGIKTMLVSGGFTFFTERLQQRYGIDYTAGNTLEIDSDGKLTGEIIGEIIDAQKKANLVMSLKQALNLETPQVIALGDGANDLKMMAVAGLSIAYHAKPIVQHQAKIAFNYVGLEGMINLLS